MCSSAFLLFAVEPLIAKRILPWFGGSAAVWSVCLVFYQSALLLGYVYARLLTRYLSAPSQSAFHIGLLLISLLFLPIGPGERWKLASSVDPAWLILALLTATIGVPFVVLSATTPLLQDWLARAGHKSPYRFFALSNFASLAALLAYPLLVEPALATSTQLVWWSVFNTAFVLICGGAAFLSRHRENPARTISARRSLSPDFEWISPWRKAQWFVLAACGSILLLSITNHIDQNVAAVPLLWVLPLAVYLLTFILGFGTAIYSRALWLRVLAFALGMLGYAIYNVNSVQALQISLPVFLLCEFACCFFCHSELNLRRPHASALTSFYLLIAAGGAAGAVFVGLIAPRIFSGIYELPVALAFTAAIAVAFTWRQAAWPFRLLWIVVAVAMVVVLAANVRAYREDALALRRSFYGSLRVRQSPHAGPQQTRTLFHGTIEHGAQFLWPPMRFHPTTYYGPESGIGILLRECFNSPKRVGLVGLGIGTLAAYGRPGDTFRFYEINSQIVDIAKSLFFYLRESRARIEIVEGDARLSLERETAPPFDVLALDAFSGDAIPVHLLTLEAMSVYRKRLKRDGVLAFHVSNDYLDLAPVVAQLAARIGSHAILIKNHSNEDDLVLAAEWVLVTNNAAVLDNPSLKMHSAPIESRNNLRLWTDDYNNLLQILKTPQLH